MKKTISAILLTSLFFGVSAQALTAKQNVEREFSVKTPDGNEVVKREIAKEVVPGERIVYSIEYYNDDQQPAEDIVLVMPVPKEIKYIEQSANADNTITRFSVDGGKTFAKRENLVKTLKDGTTRPADASDITHIRWTLTNKIAPGSKGRLEFKGVLK